MADETKVDDKVAAAAEGLKKILEVLAPEPKPEEPAAPPAPVDEVYGVVGASDVTASTTQAIAAVERYRNAMRWLVAAVAAIGVALFGSVAFTESELTGWRLLGLASAALGMVAILWAATAVFEPEDASLGELAKDLEAITEEPGRLAFRKRALWQLKEILLKDPTAHLGVGIADVDDLITAIGRAETGRHGHAGEVASARRAVARRTEDREAAQKALESLVAAREKVEQQSSKDALDTAIATAVTALHEAQAGEAEARTTLTSRLGTLAADDIPLGRHMLRRSMILDESAVAQLRGTFHASRVVLLVGAAMTLAGALVYLVGVQSDAGKEGASSVRIGSMTVAPGTDAAEELEDDCVGTVLDIAFFGGDRPGDADAFDVSVVAPQRCAGTYSMPKDRGTDDIELQLSRPVDVPKAKAEGD